MADQDPPEVIARIASGVSPINATQWDALTGGNPFVGHDFLGLLEDSGSVGPETGWTPAPIVIERDGQLVGALPAYLKTHSQGEYIFDHHWADAYERGEWAEVDDDDNVAIALRAELAGLYGEAALWATQRLASAG